MLQRAGDIVKGYEYDKDKYQIKLKELIENKIAGKEVVAAQPEGAPNVINLMDALKASVEQAKKGQETA